MIKFKYNYASILAKYKYLNSNLYNKILEIIKLLHKLYNNHTHLVSCCTRTLTY